MTQAAGETPSRTDFILSLVAIVGRRHVLVSAEHTHRYRAGFRFGLGRTLAVVRPGTLVEQWHVLSTCVVANKIVIMQAANTGLTGGSTPDGDAYDREIVIVSTLRMDQVHVVNGGKQVVCLPGTTLDLLERTLRPFGREPHSEIGSSCIGASVVGGICNNSGGSLVRRGPAFTEMSIFARVTEEGRLELINHLGVRLPGTEEEMLGRLDRRDYSEADVQVGGRGHDDRYARHVRDVDASSPARFNADANRLFEASGVNRSKDAN